MTWPAVPLRSDLGRWAGKTIAIGGQGDLNRPTTAVMRISRLRRDGQVKVTYADLAHQKLDAPAAILLPAHLTVSEAVLALAHVRPDRAGVPPKVRGLKAEASHLAMPATLAIFVVLFILAVWLEIYGLIFGLLPTFLTVMLIQMGSNRAGNTIRPRITDGGAEILASSVYQLLPRDTAAVDTAALSPASRVDLVKERFGALRDDIIYRIENSALFDGAVPQTNRYQLALLAWDPSSPSVEELATEVEAAFDEARRHAEEIGLDHLPLTARDSGRRAARAAHTALNGTTDGEREAARRRVADILGSLALYYLPAVDPRAPQLIGRRREIEPR